MFATGVSSIEIRERKVSTLTTPCISRCLTDNSPKLLEAAMRIAISVLSILVCVHTASVLAEQDATVTDVMKGSRTIGGQSIEYPKTDKAEIASVKIEIQPGKERGRHMHPFPIYVHVLEGTLTVEFEDGGWPGKVDIEGHKHQG
jgi:hypothetical protein